MATGTGRIIMAPARRNLPAFLTCRDENRDCGIIAEGTDVLTK